MKRRIDWQQQDAEHVLLSVQEQSSPESDWQDVTNNYAVHSKKHGRCVIMSIQHLRVTRGENSVGAMYFHNLHIYNPSTKHWDAISILVKHAYYRNAVDGMLDRKQNMFLLGLSCKKVPKQGGRSAVLYTMVPLDKALESKLSALPYEEPDFSEGTEGEDDLDIDF